MVIVCGYIGWDFQGNPDDLDISVNILVKDNGEELPKDLTKLNKVGKKVVDEIQHRLVQSNVHRKKNNPQYMHTVMTAE